MPQTNINVINALFESYLIMRKDNWSLEQKEGGTLNLPDPTTKQGHKVAVCTEMLQKVSTAYTTDEWIAVAHALYQLELAEKKTHDDRWMLTKMVVSPPLLLDALRAIRSYIISSLAKDALFESRLSTLREQQKNCEVEVMRLTNNKDKHSQEEIDTAITAKEDVNRKLEGLDDTDQYLDTFFKNKLLLLDPKAIELKEKTFEEFMLNVKKGLRSSALCKQLLDSKKEPKKVVAETTPQAPRVESRIVEPKPAPIVIELLEEQKSTRSRTKKSALAANSNFPPPPEARRKRTPRATVGFYDANNEPAPNPNHTTNQNNIGTRTRSKYN